MSLSQDSLLFLFSLVWLTMHFSDSLPFLFSKPDNLGEDCPVFENLFEFCQIYAGGTIGN